MTEPRIVVVGEALVDVVHRAPGTVDETPGGSPANVALTLGRLGRRPLLVTRLGADAHGREVRSWLEASRVEVAAEAAPRTSTATARLDATGAAEYEFDLAWELAPDAAAAAVADAAVLHVGSVAAVLDPGAATVAGLVQGAREHATVTYDPNIRPSLVEDAEAVRRRVADLIAAADVVKASDDDVRWLHPGEDVEEVARRWQRTGPALVVVTAGADGSLAVVAGGVVRVPAVRTDVVDTVGAGDTYMGALIDGVAARGLAGAGRREALGLLDLDELVEILERCARAAAITVSRPGADPPGADELDAGRR